MTKKKAQLANTVYDHEVVVDVLMRHTGSATVRELSKELGVSTPTINNWLKAKPAFAKMVADLRSEVDDRVESALADLALGYEAPPEITYEREKLVGPDGSVSYGELVETKRVVKHVQPQLGAASLWLTNRRPERWRQKQTVEHETGPSLRDAILGRVPEVLELEDAEWKDVSDHAEPS